MKLKENFALQIWVKIFFVLGLWASNLCWAFDAAVRSSPRRSFLPPVGYYFPSASRSAEKTFFCFYCGGD
jgi:hypothetical protein